MKKTILGLLLMISLCGCAKSRIETVKYLDKNIDDYGEEYSNNTLKVNDDYEEIDIKEGFREYTDIIDQFKKAEGFYADVYDIYYNEDQLDDIDNTIYIINNYGSDNMEANVNITNVTKNNKLTAYIKNGEYFLIQNKERMHVKWSLNHLLTYESFEFLNIKESYITNSYKAQKDDCAIYRFDINIPYAETSYFFGKGSGREHDKNLKTVTIIIKANSENKIMNVNTYFYYNYGDGDQSLVKKELNFNGYGNQNIVFPEDMESWPIVNKDSE